MFGRMSRRVAVVGALAIVFALAGTALALANGFTTPVLKSPKQGQKVHAGTITLTVFDPGVPKSVNDVGVQIEPKRKLDKNGFLRTCLEVSEGCDDIGLKPWKHHPGYWRTVVNISFPGFWAATPGKYYWQASHTAPLCQAKGCEIVSAIHSFRVVG
jgi:hypothetical protein